MHIVKKFLSCLTLAAFVASSHAAAPEVGGQAPGWFRVQLGKFEVTTLSDGSIDLPMDKYLLNATPDAVRQQLQRDFLPLPLTTSVNAFLINTGTKLILVDTGTGGVFGPSAGRMLRNLKASGYQPEQVDEILITHMHGDHIGGLTHEGKAVFPNAVVRIAKADTDYWLSTAAMDKAPAGERGGFKAAMATLKPYVDTGRLKPFAGDTEIEPGIRAIVTGGHTPGHSIYRVESAGKTLTLWGDLIHCAAVQFAHPEVAISFDSDPVTAVAQRKKAFAIAAKDGELDGGAHLSFPGLGHLRAQGAGYAWVPINYPGDKPAQP